MTEGEWDLALRLLKAVERIAEYCDRNLPPRRATPVVDYAVAARAARVERMRMLTAILLRRPVLLRDVEHAYAALDLEGAPLNILRAAILEWAETADVLDAAALMRHLIDAGLKSETDHVLAQGPVPLPLCASSGATPAEAQAGWWHILGMIDVQRLGDEIVLAEAACMVELTVARQTRLLALKAALNRVNRGEAP